MNRIPVGQKDPDIERGFRMHSPAKLRRRALATIAAAALAAPGLLMLTAPTASASVPSSAAFKSSEPFGTWNNGAFDVYNNEWNTSEAGPQTIWAFNYHHWGVESTQSASTSVKTYPSVQRNYPNRPYSTFSMLRSTFAEQMPSSGDFIAEAAYDLWLNNYSIEVMMWFDNHRQVPAGNVIARHIRRAEFLRVEERQRLLQLQAGRRERAVRHRAPVQRASLAGEPRAAQFVGHADPGQLRLGDLQHARPADGLHADQVHAAVQAALDTCFAEHWRGSARAPIVDVW